jgi:hypothetical protein
MAPSTPASGDDDLQNDGFRTNKNVLENKCLITGHLEGNHPIVKLAASKVQ